MNTPQDSSLGRGAAYPDHYDPALLFPIARRQARDEIGLDPAAVPFIGHDRWHAYELGWLDSRGKPQIATAWLVVPADSPCLIESKSLKLYLNSFNGERFGDTQSLRERIVGDLSDCAGAPVAMHWGLPPVASAAEGFLLDSMALETHDYGPPNAACLSADTGTVVDETLYSELLKSNCPVTGQPDWASVHVRYRGPRIDREGLLRYLVSFRGHAEFHEQCVERIFHDLLRHCRPQRLSVEARYTRRGGLDINPWRATPDHAPPDPRRDRRQ
ncbi:MAG: NADPH-dependent 7-cyano-7-deazaguanine reductase QueF [Xanthomonadaceae bacterium]|nr:NADPH-dependent 7-cyano-7-deazaguanine reductase QueF [Xanthomonadaceae bacterium]